MPKQEIEPKVAVWVKKTKSGNNYLSMKIEIGEDIYYANCFKNRFKSKDMHPDYTTPYVKADEAGARSNDKLDEVNTDEKMNLANENDDDLLF